MTSRRLLSALLCAACIMPALHAGASEAATRADATTALIARFGLEDGRTPARNLPGWRAPRRIVVLLPPQEAQGKSDPLAPLREVAGGAELVAVASVGELPTALGGADVLLGYCSPEIVAAGTDLRWIQSLSVGVERCVSAPGLKERQVLLTNTKQLMGPPIAEHVIALTLAFARGLHRFGAAQQRGEWNDELSERMWELEGKIMLVVGLGGIGTEVASRAHALGMRVTATRGSSREGPAFVDYVGLADELDRLAAEADVVVNCTPLTPATTGIFDREFFRRMKDSAYFINIGRGKSVVTTDMIAALEAGEFAGAGLDVVDPEPLPASSPLWRMDNVIITPHVAAGSELLTGRIWILVRENLRRYVAGEPLLNVVDLDKGY